MANDAPRERPQPGESIALIAAGWNRIAAAVEGLASLSVAPPLVLSGRTLHDLTPRKFVALLSGSSSPYSWTEQVRIGAAWVAGGRSGTASAVEVNGKSGLGGQFAWLSPCGPGEWCFQDVRVGAPACTATLTVTVRDSCTLAARSGATVQVSLAGQPTQTGTTNASGIKSFTVNAAGSWSVQVSQTGYTTQTVSAAVTCGGTTNITVDLVSTTPTTLTVTVTGCNAPSLGTPLPGATVVAVQGGVTVGTGTTNASGQVVFTLTSAATVTLTLSRTKFATKVQDAPTITCGANTSTSIALSAGPGYVCINCSTCSVEPSPATLTMTDSFDGSSNTLTYDIATARYVCTRTVTATARDATCLNPSARNVTIRYTFGCTLGSPPTFNITFPSCSSGGISHIIGDGLGGSTTAKTATRTAWNCVPVSATFTAAFLNNGFEPGVEYYGTATRTFTITE